MNRARFFNAICIASMFATTAHAQNFYVDMATGIAKQGMAEVEKLLEDAPGLLDETLKRGDVGEEFESAQYCRGALQSAVNLGAALSNTMPFSRVWTLEDERGPVGRFRIMLNGEQIHADVYCDDKYLRSVQLPWGSGSPDPEVVQVSTLSALAGAVLNFKLQGAFDSSVVQTADEATKDSIVIINPPPAVITETEAPKAPSVSAKVPLSKVEKASLSAQVQRCWNVGSLSAEALQVTVKVSFILTGNGMPDAGSITMVSYSGSDAAAARQAFEAARRAIIRCGTSGFELQVSENEEWEAITLEFDIEGMRVE